MAESQSSLLRLMQLVSPTLPVGAYAYSQGLEYAVHAGWVDNEKKAFNWIHGVMSHSLAQLDGPVFLRLYQSWLEQDKAAVEYWNAILFASRESKELQLEDRQLAQALARLLNDLGVQEAAGYLREDRLSYVNMFALAAVSWKVDAVDALQGYLWSWAENQVTAAIKLVPLGQTAGQRILLQLGDVIPGLIESARKCADEDIGQVTPGLAMASAWHETQYTRLFRS